jgi:hypothetical protein
MKWTAGSNLTPLGKSMASNEEDVAGLLPSTAFQSFPSLHMGL